MKTLTSSHGSQKYITGELLSSSMETEWDVVVAERWRHSRGRLMDTTPEITEIVICLSGKLRFERRGDGKLQRGYAVPGTVWLCPAGIRESDITISHDVKESLHLYMPPRLVSQVLESTLGSDASSVHIQYTGGFQDPLILQIGLAMRDLISGPADGLSRLLVESMSTTLCTHVINRYSSVRLDTKNENCKRGRLGKSRLDAVNAYIDQHLADHISLASLASAANLSPHHFSRAFRATTGVSPYRYAMARRIDAAKASILQHDQSLVEIALNLGFDNQSQFSRVFKRITGLTPGQYRDSTR